MVPQNGICCSTCLVQEGDVLQGQIKSIGLPEPQPRRHLCGLLVVLLSGFHVPEAGHATCSRSICFYNLLIVAESALKKNQAPLLGPRAPVGTDFHRLTLRQRPMDSNFDVSCLLQADPLRAGPEEAATPKLAALTSQATSSLDRILSGAQRFLNAMTSYACNY